ALGEQLGIGFAAELRNEELDGDLATKVPIGFAKQHRLLPITREGEQALVATADRLDVGALDDVRAQLATDIIPVLVPAQKIIDAINHIHGQKESKGNLGEGEEDEMAGQAEELV